MNARWPLRLALPVCLVAATAPAQPIDLYVCGFLSDNLVVGDPSDFSFAERIAFNSADAPCGIAVASEGTTYVSFQGGPKNIRVYDAAGEFLRDLTGPISNGGAGLIRLHEDRGELFVAGARAKTVHRINVTTGAIWESITPAASGNVYGLFLDGDLLYIPSFGSAQVAIYDISVLPAVLVNVIPSAGVLQDPLGLATLPDGSLLVGNWGDGQLHRFDPVTTQWLGRFADLTLLGKSHVHDVAFDPVAELVYVSGSDTPDVGVYDLGGNLVGVHSSLVDTPYGMCLIVRDCAPDINGDGVVNTQDFLAFLNAWAAGDPAADWNADGTINTIDFIAYLGDWAAGC